MKRVDKSLRAQPEFSSDAAWIQLEFRLKDLSPKKELLFKRSSQCWVCGREMEAQLEMCVNCDSALATCSGKREWLQNRLGFCYYSPTRGSESQTGRKNILRSPLQSHELVRNGTCTTIGPPSPRESVVELLQKSGLIFAQGTSLSTLYRLQSYLCGGVRAGDLASQTWGRSF